MDDLRRLLQQIERSQGKLIPPYGAGGAIYGKGALQGQAEWDVLGAPYKDQYMDPTSKAAAGPRTYVTDPGAQMTIDITDKKYKGERYKLGDVYNSPELYRLMPWLKNTEFSLEDMGELIGGFNPKRGDIRLNPNPTMHRDYSLDASGASVLGHEMQHAIDQKEGIKGIPYQNFEAMIDKVHGPGLSPAMKQTLFREYYIKSQAEARARAVQSMNRRQAPSGSNPFQYYDVPSTVDAPNLDYVGVPGSIK